ncbi:mitogen-activated protein kinase kinase kinase NPK1-like [Zingiber officinale]|uniref:mitogen-activated protein kinase kinase kinase NPK1-like n=1 Tax=Zingiber officinale TaxID=94328 RepID=UPI001C4D7005|nr:mitogen-activated protein kinase kinase kinase NPK1-like [Zingiber officinale]
MHEVFGSVRRSLVFRTNPDGNAGGGVGGIAEKIGSCLRKSRIGLGLGFGGFAPKLPPPPSPEEKDNAASIRWRKGELIGCGAFGHVYMGMNLDSGELLAVKQVLIGKNGASKEKAQAHIRELEEEVKLLKNLSHPNIVRYLGTTREDDTLNIFLEFVPGGSISSLLGKFGSFPEAVIRMYTKQLLQGLEYLHRNGIMHRDIKGANILVDNKGCIKLADFGASKQVAKLATMNAAKSMKGTPYWMAPEVILQTGHSFSADIWSVGCTIIEMATGKPPWSQQYQEVAALFHIGTTKSHPPIPEHLSSDSKDFLLKCLQKEPNLRSTASDLLQHPFVTNEFQDLHPTHHLEVAEPSKDVALASKFYTKIINSDDGRVDNDESNSGNFPNVRPIWELSNNSSMCRLDDTHDFPNVGSSFNPMSEPLDEWPRHKFDMAPEPSRENLDGFHKSVIDEHDFTFSEPVADDDEEATESKIRAFLDEKALDLKKLQTPLYEEFYNSLNNKNGPCPKNKCEENITKIQVLPPKIKMSPNKVANRTAPLPADMANKVSPGNCSRRESRSDEEDDRVLREISPQLNEWEGLFQDAKQESMFLSFSERQRKWKEELDQELAREREMFRQAATQGKTSSPTDGWFARKKDRNRSTSSGK